MVRRIPDIFFGTFEEESPSWDFPRKCMEPLVYVNETEDDILITADLPCVEKDALGVKATENSIEIEAKVMKPLKFERWGVRQREIHFSSFKKIVNLKSRIDPDKSRAKFKKGVLKITAPKVVKRREIIIE
jgi:HSP20 family protein